MGHACLGEFRRGRRERARFPLRSGIYKLREVRRRLAESLSLMSEVCMSVELNRTSTSARAPQGTRGALQRLPKVIAHELGRNIIPAVEALVGDDVPRTMAKALAKHARVEANALVRRCDDLNDDFTRHRIDVELVRMKYDRSVLEQLLTDAVGLIDKVLPKEQRAFSQTLNDHHHRGTS
jgi:hypothetical protein